MGLSVYALPTDEPISLAEAKRHCRIDVTDDDGLLAGIILASRVWTEGYTRRALCTQTLDLTLDCWPRCIVLPRPPHQSVTSISYVDTSGAAQTLDPSNYQVDLSDAILPARIMPAYQKTWPTIQSGIFNPITVRFVAGYGSNPSKLPDPIRQAMLLVIGHLYENRETVLVNAQSAPLVMGARALLDPYRDPCTAF